MSKPFISVPEAIQEFARGHMVIIVDDEHRENEGDLTLAAQFVTPQAINFMATHGRGLVCLSLTEENTDHLQLRPMTQANTSRFGTAFTESIEAKDGVTTGISAHDRARTIKVAIDRSSTAGDLARPGHVFPLRARKGGVLVRPGQTEASVDLARLAGLLPAAVICEIMNDDGTMARIPDLIEFCSGHSLKMLTVAELIRYRLHTERFIHRVNEAVLPTDFADFRMVCFGNDIYAGDDSIALVLGDVTGPEPALVYVHSQCVHGDVFGSALCDCRNRIEQSMRAIASAGCGALVYLQRPQELAHTGRCAAVESNLGGMSDDELKRAALASQIVSDLGIRKVRLLTNTRKQSSILQAFGLEIVEQVTATLANTVKLRIGVSEGAHVLNPF